MSLRLFIFLALFALKGIVAQLLATAGQQCRLTAKQMDKHWIYATKDAGYGYDLLHTDFLEDQQRLYLICNESFILTSVCNQGYLQPALPPKTKCDHRLKATVDLMPAPNDCYANKMAGKMYQVHYKWSDGSAAFLYDVCYSQRDEAALYARHHAYGFNLPSSHRGPDFTLDGVVTKARADSFFARSVYYSFNLLLGYLQTYVKSSTHEIIDRGHLANKNDFLTFDQMDATFKFVNIMPQFNGSNNGNWKRVEEWIHKLPANNKYASVVSGMYGILELPHSQWPHRLVPMYLMAAQRKNPLPLWTYKVVEYEKKCHAFVTLNNDFNEDWDIRPDICIPVFCPDTLNINRNTKFGITYCCDYRHMVKSVGSHLQLC